MATLENKLDYLESLGKDIEEFIGKQSQYTMEKYLELVQEHFNAVMGIANEDLAGM